ncbi:penicillin-binding protein 1C [Labrenzia sp. OB1]|uniref:penicillin-binding protein 1C n=1 Tax=Labrenzia sp. OB1 TaxID=1561204 RepID=UPI0007B1F8AD|nr:penicillin-binding protein 1C [Labrenzia sp. OB1]KZM48857.1 penicillin-binding protein [Labrenzia sp. OB1]
MKKGPRQGWRATRRWAIAAGLGALVFAVGGGLKVRHDFNALPALPQIGDLSLSVTVLDRDDRLLRAFTSGDDKWRLPVDLEEIDPLYFKMLLAFEDRRFFDHGGIDIRALVRSALQSARAGRIVSGGSTLTMQVARLLDEAPTRTFMRKYEQLLKAVQLERSLSKQDILRLYALRAPFGGNLEGIRAASLTWFGKEPRRLTPAEAALLVALPQSPEARRPDRFRENARTARNRVLARAATAGVLTPEEAGSASAEPVRAARHPMPFLAPHESRHARLTDPLKPVHRLTIDRDLQAALEKLSRQKIGSHPKPVSMAVMVADHRTGDILVSIGAPELLDSTRQGHVDMTRAVRSPGSTLKPFIYGLAFEEGIGFPESYIDDRPTDIGGYKPTNFDQAYQGTVTLREALQLSLNTPAVQLLEAVGPARLMARLRRAGVRPALEKGAAPGLAIGLGGLGLTLKDLTQLYASLARQGEPVSLSVCRAECERDSMPVSEAGKGTDVGSRRTADVLSRKSAWLVSDILSGLPQLRGAEASHIAYKTGTAYGYRDAWAVGYDGRYVVSVWLGRADGTPVPGATGASAAVPVLFEIFQQLGPGRRELPEAPPEVLQMTSSEVPGPLRYARLPGRREAARVGDALKISYPPDGAELDLGFGAHGSGAPRSQPLVVKLKGGSAPFSILVNGTPLAEKARRHQLVWQPDAPGYLTVTILDSNGKSAGITVFLR